MRYEIVVLGPFRLTAATGTPAWHRAPRFVERSPLLGRTRELALTCGGCSGGRKAVLTLYRLCRRTVLARVLLDVRATPR